MGRSNSTAFISLFAIFNVFILQGFWIKSDFLSCSKTIQSDHSHCHHEYESFCPMDSLSYQHHQRLRKSEETHCQLVKDHDTQKADCSFKCGPHQPNSLPLTSQETFIPVSQPFSRPRLLSHSFFTRCDISASKGHFSPPDKPPEFIS